MGDQENTPVVKTKRAVTVLKLTGRNQEEGEAKAIGEAIYAVAIC